MYENISALRKLWGFNAAYTIQGRTSKISMALMYNISDRCESQETFKGVGL